METTEKTLLEAEEFLRENKFVPYEDPFYIPNFLRNKEKSQESVEQSINKSINSLTLRSKYITKFGFAIPTVEALTAIAKLSPLLEIGAGSGYWAYELQKLGVDIIPVEPKLTTYGFWRDGDEREASHWKDKTYTKLVRITGQKAVRQYPERNLFFCWPDYGKPWTGKTLEASKCERVAYIGEGNRGCTGDDRFHEILEKDFEEEEFINLPQFFGLHDNLTIYKRR